MTPGFQFTTGTHHIGFLIKHMKRRTSTTIGTALLLTGSSGSPFVSVSGFAPAPIVTAPKGSTSALRAPPPASSTCKALRAALSPNGGNISADQPSRMAVTLVDNAGGDTSANTEDGLLESVLGSIDLDLDLDEDPLQTVLDNTASTPNNRLINLGLLTAVAVAALSALLTVDLAGGITRGWTVAETAARIPLDDWAFYNDVLRTHPILTKAATSGTVYAIGDVIAQSTEGRDVASLDRGRVTRSLLAGLLAHGPLSHYWYLISEDFFDRVVHLTEWWSVFPKILVDQTVWGPIWTSVYLLMIGLMQRDGLGSIGDNIRRSIVPLTLSGLKLWPAAHIITVS